MDVIGRCPRAPRYADAGKRHLWFKNQVLSLTGVDPKKTPLGPPTTQVFSWSSQAAELSQADGIIDSPAALVTTMASTCRTIDRVPPLRRSVHSLSASAQDKAQHLALGSLIQKSINVSVEWP